MSWLNSAINWCLNFEKNLDQDYAIHPFWKQCLDEFSKYNWQKDFQLDEFLLAFNSKCNDIKQLNAHSPFGEPPLTLFYSEKHKFVLDMYIWKKAQTTIHDHGFEGCFQVLEGESIESTYEFTPHKNQKQSCFGELISKELNLLKPSMTRPIKPNNGTTHRVLHLKNPTITLCLRSVESLTQYKQQTYSFRMMATPSFLSEASTIKLRLLNFYLGQSQLPPKALIDDLKDYYQTWESFSKSKEHHKYMRKMEIFYQCYGLVDQIIAQEKFNRLFTQLQSVQAKIILTAFEYHGAELCFSWISEKLNLNKEQAKEILQKELTIANIEQQPGNDLLFLDSFFK